MAACRPRIAPHPSAVLLPKTCLQGVASAWGGVSAGVLAPPARVLDFEELLHEAHTVDATLLLFLDDSTVASGELQQALELAGIAHTGIGPDFVARSSTRMALSKVCWLADCSLWWSEERGSIVACVWAAVCALMQGQTSKSAPALIVAVQPPQPFHSSSPSNNTHLTSTTPPPCTTVGLSLPQACLHHPYTHPYTHSPTHLFVCVLAHLLHRLWMTLPRGSRSRAVALWG